LAPLTVTVEPMMPDAGVRLVIVGGEVVALETVSSLGLLNIRRVIDRPAITARDSASSIQCLRISGDLRFQLFDGYMVEGGDLLPARAAAPLLLHPAGARVVGYWTSLRSDEDVVTVNCPQCGNEYLQTDKHCPGCGLPLEAEAGGGKAPGGGWRVAGRIGLVFLRVTSNHDNAVRKAGQESEKLQNSLEDINRKQNMDTGLTGDRDAVEKAAVDYAGRSGDIPLADVLQPDGVNFLTTGMAEVYVKDVTSGKRYRVTLSKTGSDWTAISITGTI
jgi:predicted RNA-binding Zn-ribbon protein involved in translation (DUF1610 family)